ncbi:MAG TPA: hypothetical protein VJC11_01960 [Patescibacteria group bacterium]|nr:hypothetical protein [Patescibacteria group bacterium]
MRDRGKVRRFVLRAPGIAILLDDDPQQEESLRFVRALFGPKARVKMRNEKEEKGRKCLACWDVFVPQNGWQDAVTFVWVPERSDPDEIIKTVVQRDLQRQQVLFSQSIQGPSWTERLMELIKFFGRASIAAR